MTNIYKDEDFISGVTIAAIEAACNILCCEEDDEDGYQIGGHKWNAMYAAGLDNALDVLRSCKDIDEVAATIRDEIACEDLLEDFPEEALRYIINLL